MKAVFRRSPVIVTLSLWPSAITLEQTLKICSISQSNLIAFLKNLFLHIHLFYVLICVIQTNRTKYFHMFWERNCLSLQFSFLVGCTFSLGCPQSGLWYTQATKRWTSQWGKISILSLMSWNILQYTHIDKPPSSDSMSLSQPFPKWNDSCCSIIGIDI